MAAVLWLLPLLAVTYSSDQLKLAILMFRHGDRSAIQMVPNDIYNETSWPQGMGQLSTIGMQAHLKNGQFFRYRYALPDKDTYLDINPNYKRDQVYVRSTDKDRTLMSALSMLSGLFTPENNTMQSPLNVWQPIPVHTRPINTEPMLDGSPSACKEWKKSFSETISNNQDFIAFMENNTEIAAKIVNVTGIATSDDPLEFGLNLAHVYDSLFCEQSSGMPLKEEFVRENILELAKKFEDEFWEMYLMLNDLEKSLAGGVLLRELKDRVKAAVEGQEDAKKLVLFSGHDTTLAAALTALGVYDGIQTPYATVLMLELWEGQNETYTVSLSRHHKDDDLITYTMPGCNNTKCPLDIFQSLNSHLELTEDKYQRICDGTDKDIVDFISKNTLFFLLCAVILLSLGSIAALTVYSARLRNSNSGQSYAKLEQQTN